MPSPLINDIPLSWHAGGVTLVITMFLLNRGARAANIVVVCLTQLPGVILHELAHLTAGLLFRAAPCRFNLIPERSQHGGWALGSVEFQRVTAFNAVPIALAPLGLIPLAYCLYRYWFNWLPLSFANTLMLYAALFLTVYNALPSRQDIRVACNWKSLLLYGCICGSLIYWLLYYRT